MGTPGDIPSRPCARLLCGSAFSLTLPRPAVRRVAATPAGKAAGKRAGRVAVLADEGWRKRTAADRTGQGEDPLDLWLRRSLHEAFDPALEEPVPGDILRLIEEDRAERERLRRRRAAERSG